MAGKLIKLCVAEVSFRLGKVCLTRTRQEPTWQIAVCKLEQKLNMDKSWSHARWNRDFSVEESLTSTLSGQLNLSFIQTNGSYV